MTRIHPAHRIICKAKTQQQQRTCGKFAVILAGTATGVTAAVAAACFSLMSTLKEHSDHPGNGVLQATAFLFVGGAVVVTIIPSVLVSCYVAKKIFG